MLVILIATGWVVLAAVGLSMGRLAAASDESHAVAVAEWFASRDPVPHLQVCGEGLEHRGGDAHEAIG